MDYKKEISTILTEHANINEDEIYNMLETPKESKMGDFAFPCFSLAKLTKTSPQNVATSLIDKIDKPMYIEKVEAISGYLNFFIKREDYAMNVITNVLASKDYGKSKVGEGKTIVIDYSSLNIAKPFHVGHLKNAVTGDSLYKIFKFLGYNSIGINHLGDLGTQFGKLIVAYKKWGDDEKIKQNTIYELADLYVRFHDELESNPELEEEGRLWSHKIEEKDEEAIKIWSYFKDISLEYFNKLAEKLDLHFDYLTGESFYVDMIQDTVKLLESSNILEESDGAKIVNLDDMPPCLIVRSDGASLYVTRDLAAAIYRYNEFKFDKCIYITGSEQKLHFAQFFKVLEKMGYPWAKDLVHIAHGMVRLEDGKISTRKGNTITLEDAISESTKKALLIIEEKNPNLENKEQVAEDVGIGAMVFNNLYYTSNKDIVFSWKTALSFDGETGPYLQYTHARASSILRKVIEIDESQIDYSILTDDTSFDIVKLLSRFPDVIMQAASLYEPFYVSRYLMDLAHAFNKFYNEQAVVVADEKVKNTRAALVSCTQKVLKTGLYLICMRAPEEM